MVIERKKEINQESIDFISKQEPSVPVFLYIRSKIISMEKSKKSRGLYWLLFFVSVIAFVLVLMFQGQWVTLTLPFIFTFFALAMNIM